jgi:tetratricopeptide (TPR) repeat protein
MFYVKISLIIIAFSLLACGKKTDRQKTNPVAVRLNDRAVGLYPYIDNIDSANKAIKLLDSATIIDSNYFQGYYNKLGFLNQHREYEKAIKTINILIRLRPYANDIYLSGGVIYEVLGDSLSSRVYFQKSLAICDRALDTMSTANRDYIGLAINESVNLIMLGQQTKGNLLLKQVYENQSDSSLKQLMHPFLNRSRQEIIDMFLNPKKYWSTVSSSAEAKYN